jgi:hypothetical protein
MEITPASYKRERMKRGTQAAVAARLQVQRVTIARRETTGPVTREAWLALCALPVAKKVR